MRPSWYIDGNPDPSLGELRIPPVPPVFPVVASVAQSPATARESIYLRWNFRTTFPRPLESAIEAGRLEETDRDPENLASLHNEYARHLLALLSDIDHVHEAKRNGIDPRTGKPPRTEKKKEEVARIYKDEPALYQHGMDIMFDVYAEAFGEEASEAFKTAITAWHAGLDVLEERADGDGGMTMPSVRADGLPLPRALSKAVEAGVFGFEGDPPQPIDPSEQEIVEITENLIFRMCAILAEQVRSLPPHEPDRFGRAAKADAQYQACLEQYREDFGDEATRVLDKYVRRQVAEDIGEELQDFDRGHPWHYLLKGDGATPVNADDIPASNRPFDVGIKLPKDPTKRLEKLRTMRSDAERQLDQDILRYEEIVEKGVSALSDYDRKIAYGGDDELAWASAVALKYNHISNGRWREEGLTDLIDQLEAGKIFQRS